MAKKNEKAEAGNEKTYTIVSIGGENYAIDVMHVNNINGFTEIRPVPNTKPFMKGVISLRETIVPVIDMRVLFNLKSEIYAKTTVIVIVGVYNRLIGLLVDAVLDVTSLTESEVHDTPHFSANINEDFISGISEINGKLVIILNINKIITKEDLENFADDAL